MKDIIGTVALVIFALIISNMIIGSNDTSIITISEKAMGEEINYLVEN